MVFLAQASVFYLLKQSQSLGDTRQKFDVADVEGRKQISSLKKQVANAQERDAEETKHEWPALTDQQISEWTKALAPSRGTTEVMHVIWAQDVEAKKLFRSLQKVGKAVGISVQNWGGSADGNKIEVRDLHGGVGKALVELFDKSGYPAVLQTQGVEWGTKSVEVYIPARPMQP